MLGTAGVVLACLAGAVVADAAPEPVAVALAFSDQVAAQALPEHLARVQPTQARYAEREVLGLLRDTGRVVPAHGTAIETGNGYRYAAPEGAGYLVHAVLSRLDKVYRNRVVYGPELQGTELGFGSVIGATATGVPYEVLALPVVTGRLELRLVDLSQGRRVLWSALQDCTVRLPFSAQRFVYNPERYPGRTPLGLARRHMGDFLRLQESSRSAGQALRSADRWFVSTAPQDVRAGRQVIEGLVDGFFRGLDGHLPLEGRVASLDGVEVGLDMGIRHGLAPGVDLDVWRSGARIGRIEIVRVDSATAVAHVRDLEEADDGAAGIRPGDRVVSSTRTSHRTREP